MHQQALPVALAQKTQDAGKKPGPTWGLTQEAQYFADLDAEELIEDDQEAHEGPSCSQHALDMQTHTSLCTAQQNVHVSQSSSHVQTPDAIALAKYHPALQVRLFIQTNAQLEPCYSHHHHLCT